jgi:hypothetical protein
MTSKTPSTVRADRSLNTIRQTLRTREAPALKDLTYETVRFAGLHKQGDIWRGQPRPELDEAWESVTWKGVLSHHQIISGTQTLFYHPET